MIATIRRYACGLILACLPLFCAGAGKAAKITKADADSAYAHEQYEKAGQMYEQLLKENGESANLYYNLGNAYYRQDKVALAILNYERAALFDPGDSDIRFNLEMARSKTIDKVVPESELFFVSTFRSVVLRMSVDQWAWMAVVFFILMLAFVALYLFAPSLWAQKTSFFIAVLCLLGCVFANVAAFQLRRQIANRNGAIIMAPSVVVKSTPSESGTDLFILHEGTRVKVVDSTMKEWCEIRMSDGKEGWMKKDKMERI